MPSMRVDPEIVSRIPGWGSDLNPEDRPAVPKEKSPPGGTGAHWSKPEHQRISVRINRSKETPRVTPVFGSANPPAGLSGFLRNKAYRDFSEGQVRHWLMLIFADRVDMVENTFGDLARGRIPNLFREMGLKSELRYNRKKVLTTTSILVLGAAAFMAVRSILPLKGETI